MNSCYFCNTEVDDDYFCFGCKEAICDACERCVPYGNHEVDEHVECEFDIHDNDDLDD